MPATKTRTVPSLDKALGLLELLTRCRSGLTLPELVEKSGLPKSSAHYLLVTLERRGYVHRSERTGRYMPGVQLFSMANLALNGLGVRQRADPYLSALRLRTGLTVHMAILDNNEAVLVARHDAHGGMRVATWVGKRMDLHCTGLGKALIAFLPEKEIEAVVRERGLARHNENTISTPRRLQENLQRVVKLGYALDDEEDELGTRCIGAPVFASGDRPIASVSLVGSLSEINHENVAQLAEELKSTARALGRVFADVSPTTSTGAVALSGIAC
ncbi:MAG: IclR family transcriptional regulator [Acidobacteria bacterium]|nr:IclR family transcriptional regulator [Acidobacteriota bacterium]